MFIMENNLNKQNVNMIRKQRILTPMTRQPPQGRYPYGGLRLGMLEKDAIIIKKEK